MVVVGHNANGIVFEVGQLRCIVQVLGGAVRIRFEQDAVAVDSSLDKIATAGMGFRKSLVRPLPAAHDAEAAGIIDEVGVGGIEPVGERASRLAVEHLSA